MIRAFILTIVLGLSLANLASGQYRYQPLTAEGRPIRYLLDSNDQGDMVGSVPTVAAATLDGFKLPQVGPAQFWATDGFLTYPTSINNAGTIVGVNIPVPAALPQGFLRTAQGQQSSYNFPDALGTIPFGINNLDVISGFYVTSTGRKGFVRSTDGLLSRTVEYAGANETQLFAINDSGVVGGGFYDAQGIGSPFLYDIHSASFTLLPKPISGDNYIVSSVNESGDALVFGMRSAAENYADRNSYVYDAGDGTLTQLQFPNAKETYGYELRNDGSVIGYYQNPDGTYGGFVAVVPEPSSLIPWSVAGLFMLFRRQPSVAKAV